MTPAPSNGAPLRVEIGKHMPKSNLQGLPMNKEDDVEGLVARLNALVIMDDVGSDNPLGREAASTILSLKSDRDALKREWNELVGDYHTALARAQTAEARVAGLVEGLRQSKKAISDLITSYTDGDNEGEHGGDHDDPECPTCQIIVRAQDAYRKARSLLSVVEDGSNSSSVAGVLSR